MMDRIIHGDCCEVLKTLPSGSVDFVLTDPPYFVRYRDRSGRSVQNDGNDDPRRFFRPAGNRSHPTEKDVRVLKPVIQAFRQPGAVVLDPFSGSGSTSVAAALAKRRYIAIELERQYCQPAEKRLAGVARHTARGP